MIKKIFISLLSVIGLGISFSSAYNCNGQLIQCDGLEFGQVPNNWDGIFNGTVSDNKFNFSAVNSKYFLSKIDNKIVLYYWWERDGLHYTSQYWNGSNQENGKINGYYICSQLPNLGYSYGLNTYNYCLYNSGFDSLSYNIKNIDRYSFNCGHSVSSSNCIVCVYKDGGDSYYCIDTSNKTVLGSSLLNSNTIEELATYNYYTFYDISYNTGGSVAGINLRLDNTIKYYEDRYGWDINMCYVGTNNLSGVWGDSVEFEYGSGLTIYGLYHGLYNSFGSNSIKNVGSFINTWLLNYYGWFVTPNDERLYLANYNGPDTNITLIYTGFTFPFENNPIAIYFMSDLLASDYVAENSQGEEIAYYCELKLSYDLYKDGTKSFDELNNLINPNIRDRIEGYNSVTLGYQSGYSLPSGSGTWSNYSGYDIPSDLSPTSLFKDFYNKLDNLSNGFIPLNSVGIIPWWILYPMIFLILFRILRH